MFLDVKFSDIDSVPAFVSHRLTVTQPDANGQEQTHVVTDPPNQRRSPFAHRLVTSVARPRMAERRQLL
jgi:hypothetical protein